MIRATAVAGALMALPAAAPRALADEPPRLGIVYERQILNALQEADDAVLPRRRNERAFFTLVGDRAVVVAAALRRLLNTRTPPDDRRAAVRGLGFLRRPQDAEACALSLADDTDPQVRRSAAVALGRIGGETARRALTRAASVDPDPAVQTESCNGLYLTGHPAVPWVMARLARSATGAVAGVLDGWRAVFQLQPEEWEVLSRPAPAKPGDSGAAVSIWVSGDTSADNVFGPWGALHHCLHGGADVARALADAVDSADADEAERARRALWLRELLHEGLAAQRADAITAVVPAAIAALDGADHDRRAAARRWLAWLAGRDLGPATPPWRSWWGTVRDTLRPPPAGEPPRPNPATVRSR